MNYNLKQSLPLNFNYNEIREQSLKNCADIIFLTYLHLYYLSEVPPLQTLVKRLNLSAYPTVDFDYYTATDLKTKQIKSIFCLEKPITKLTYTQILKEDIDDYDKVIYLKMVDRIPPYSGSKYIPEEFVSSIPTSLIVCGLIKEVDKGFVLLKERV